jgi:hypothetical protein
VVRLLSTQHGEVCFAVSVEHFYATSIRLPHLEKEQSLMTSSATTAEISISFLTWVNDELQNQVDVITESELAQNAQRFRIKTVLAASLWSVAFAAWQFVQW